MGDVGVLQLGKNLAFAAKSMEDEIGIHTRPH